MAAEYEESRVVGREQELGKIRSFFSEHIDSWSGGSLYVCGRSGTGKTEAVKQVFNGLRLKVSNDPDSSPAKGPRAKKTKLSRTIRMVWTMGTSTSGTSFLSNLARDCGIKVTKNLDVSLDDAFGKRRDDVLYIVVTDEIDLLPSEVVRRMFNWATENSSLVLLGIANVVNAGSRLFRFDQNVPKELPFEPYKVVELKPIIEKKLGEDLARFDPKALELCIRKAEKNSSGDVRTCLGWCERLLSFHKNSKHTLEATTTSSKLIGLADVVRVTGPMETPQSRRIQSLPAQSRFALVACVVAHRKQQHPVNVQRENPLLADDAIHNKNDNVKEDEEMTTFDEWIGEKVLKESWQMLREVWKIPIEGNLQEHLDRLRENDVVSVQTKKATGKKTGTCISYKIKANSKDIETALLKDDTTGNCESENSTNFLNHSSSSSSLGTSSAVATGEETACITNLNLAKRRPIFLAFKGIRPRVLANMHAVSS